MKYLVNKDAIGECLEEAIIDTGSGFVLTDKKERTIVLNEVGYWVLRNCQKNTKEDILTKLKNDVKEGLPEDLELRNDIQEFLELLVTEGVVSVYDT